MCPGHLAGHAFDPVLCCVQGEGSVKEEGRQRGCCKALLDRGRKFTSPKCLSQDQIRELGLLIPRFYQDIPGDFNLNFKNAHFLSYYVKIYIKATTLTVFKWYLEHLQCCATITTTHFQNFFIIQTDTLCSLNSNSLFSPGVTSDLLLCLYEFAYSRYLII